MLAVLQAMIVRPRAQARGSPGKAARACPRSRDAGLWVAGGGEAGWAAASNTPSPPMQHAARSCRAINSAHRTPAHQTPGRRH